MRTSTYISDTVSADRTIISVDDVSAFLKTTNKRGEIVPLWMTLGVNVKVGNTSHVISSARVHADNRSKAPDGQSGFLVLTQGVSVEDGYVNTLVTMGSPILTTPF